MVSKTELNNTLQQDLLKHMMVDRVDIEVDNQVDGKRFAIICSIMINEPGCEKVLSLGF